MTMTNGAYLQSYLTYTFHNAQPSQDGDRKTSEVMTII